MSSPSAASAAACQVIGMPAYFKPGELWDQTIAAAPTLQYVVLNPASGPGLAADAGYAAMVERAQDEGIEVLGYVDTEYGSRTVDEVKDEIDRYDEWYGIDGIFVDRATGLLPELPYYRRIARYVRENTSGRVAINPGSYPDESYAKIADVILTFEGDADTYLQTQTPEWVHDYPASRFWHLIYSTSEEQLAAVLERSREEGAGVVYVTDRPLPNPWDMPPVYWEAEWAALARPAPPPSSGGDGWPSRHGPGSDRRSHRDPGGRSGQEDSRDSRDKRDRDGRDQHGSR